MRTRSFLIGLTMVALSAVPIVASAQPSPVTADPVLKQLYLQQIQLTKPNTSLEKTIGKERLRVRADEVKALEALVNAASVDEVVSNPSSTTTALQKQQALVDMLQARRQETKVDHDLLQEEESALADAMDSATSGTMPGMLRRKADIYARRAVYEERLYALDDAITQQQDRLQRLQAQERYQQFAGVIQVVFYLGIFLLIIVGERLVRRNLIVRIRDRNRRYLVVKLFTGAVYIAMIAWILYRLSGDYPGFVTSFAIVGAGIAVALQSIVKDIVGWILIVQKRLFALGHRVTIGPYTGDVADISLLRTTIVEVANTEHTDIARSGQTLYIPNSIVLDHPVLNFHATSDFVDAEVPVTITYTSDWKKAEAVLRGILEEEVGEYVESARRQHAYRTAHFFAAQEPPEPRVFTDLVADGVLFTLRFQIPIGMRRIIISGISQKILDRFSVEKINLAYKTVTVVQ